MGSLQLNSCGLATSCSSSSSASHTSRHFHLKNMVHCSSGNSPRINNRRTCKFITRAVDIAPGTRKSAEPTTDDSQQEQEQEQDPPVVNFAFVHSVLLPDGTPDVHYRRTCGGQKLRDIMLDNVIELYGPFGRPLLNCAGGGTCGTCIVEVVEGKELLNPRTDKEKEKLNKKPKNWRLACQATVGTADSRGLLVIQQLPEWKAHEWKYEKVVREEEPDESSEEDIQQ